MGSGTGTGRRQFGCPAIDHVRDVLDADSFDDCVRTGAAMTISEAVHYAHHIQLARLHRA